MGKHKWLLVIFSFILLLSSCYMRKDIDSDQVSQEDEQEEVQIDEEPFIENIRVTGEMHDSQYLEWGAKTSSGYYEVLVWPRDMYSLDSVYEQHGNIVFTDYKTAKRVFLCSIPGCAHNNSNCTSYVEFYYDMALFTNYSETKLYLLSKGSPAHDYSTEEELPSIIEMNMDGSNRRLLCKLDSNESFSPSNKEIASDDHVFLSVSRTWKEGKDARTRNVLVSICLHDGKRQDVIDDEDWGINRSVWDDRYLITYRYNDDGVWFDKRDTDGTLLQKYGPYSAKGVYYSNKKVFLANTNGKEGTLSIIDLETDTRKEVGGIPAETEGYITCYGEMNGYIHWLFIRAGENGKTEEYIIDVENGTYKEFSLDYYDVNGVYRKAGIIGKTKDNVCLVQVGDKKSSLTLMDLEGVPHTYEYQRPIRAVMNLSDYTNGEPIYTIVEDTV